MNKALLIGINKYPIPNELNGCVNDATDMADFLVKRCGFAKSEVRMLVDERATAANILERVEWLVKDLKKGDRVLFHYSGHGVQLATRNAQGEADGLDEAICPVDFHFDDEKTIIRDKKFGSIFKNIPAGVQFTWISDSCYSAGMSKGFMQPSGKVQSIKRKTFHLPADILWRNLSVAGRNVKRLGIKGVAEQLNLALISGCGEAQPSADASFDKRYNGALTYYLLRELYADQGTKMKLSQLVQAVVEKLQHDKFDQIPELLGDKGIHDKCFLEQ